MSERPLSPQDVDLVEIYHTHNSLDADVIRDEILGPNGVRCAILDRTSRAFPTPTMMGALYIAVADEDAERARGLLREALAAGVIAKDGGFSEEEV
jgi:hypothetical protein